MSTSATDPRLLRLHPDDNVLTAICTLEPGDDALRFGAHPAPITSRIPLGHKVAARDIRTGEKIFKYGAPIGSATCEIPQGTLVHTHNMKSDYLPTWLREDHARLYQAQHGTGTCGGLVIIPPIGWPLWAKIRYLPMSPISMA